MKFNKLFASLVAVSLSISNIHVSAKTILLVPQDNRPVSLAYTVSTAEKAGYTVLTPPEQYLSTNHHQGLPELIWSWIDNNIEKADAAVISTDTLIYGGLVDSRKHTDSIDKLMSREKRIQQLHEKFPQKPIYAFGTIMRTPYASNTGVEPYYYTKYGPTIYHIAVLQDKLDKVGLTPNEEKQLTQLKASIPTEYLQDWFNRREKNNAITQNLIKYTKDNIFTYFCLGLDDSTVYSQSEMEARYLKNDFKNLSENKLGAFPGADQLALLLIARYHVDDNQLSPTFNIIYPLGRGEDTIPSYESQPVGKTIAQHITAVGGTININTPDIVLAANTPLFTTKESGQLANFKMSKPSTKEFVASIKNTINKGTPVSIMDIYFANGSDNTLMGLLSDNELLYKVASYNGWNTASNTIGYSIAQAILAPSMSKQNHKNMLIEQYIDNWAYQANVRKNLYQLSDKYTSKTKKERISPIIEQELIAEIQEFAEKKMNLNPSTISAKFPWSRLFEIHALVSNKPVYPKILTIAEQERIAEEKRLAEEKEKQEALKQKENNSQEENFSTQKVEIDWPE